MGRYRRYLSRRMRRVEKRLVERVEPCVVIRMPIDDHGSNMEVICPRNTDSDSPYDFYADDDSMGIRLASGERVQMDREVLMTMLFWKGMTKITREDAPVHYLEDVPEEGSDGTGSD